MRGWLFARIGYLIGVEEQFAEQGVMVELPQTIQVGEVEAALQSFLDQVPVSDTSPRLRKWIEEQITWAQIFPYSMFRD